MILWESLGQQPNDASPGVGERVVGRWGDVVAERDCCRGVPDDVDKSFLDHVLGPPHRPVDVELAGGRVDRVLVGAAQERVDFGGDRGPAVFLPGFA